MCECVCVWVGGQVQRKLRPACEIPPTPHVSTFTAVTCGHCVCASTMTAVTACNSLPTAITSTRTDLCGDNMNTFQAMLKVWAFAELSDWEVAVSPRQWSLCLTKWMIIIIIIIIIIIRQKVITLDFIVVVNAVLDWPSRESGIFTE